MSAPITIEAQGSIEILTLNRPDKQNAVDVDMAQALCDYFAELPKRLEVRVVVLQSTGKHFSAGADLDSPAFVPPGKGRAQQQMAIQHIFSGVVRLMRNCPQPIIGLIQGAAVGAGFSLTLASDVRIGTAKTRMSAAYLRIGLGGCDMGSGYLLPRLVGVSTASEFLLTGNFINAERALSCGLLSQVVEQDTLLDCGLQLANDMLKASPMGLRMTKESINGSLSVGSLEAGLMLEDRQQVILLDTEDHREAVQAFRDKRDPVYSDS
jgi:enoyl-CoA hydratase/carnithine racemase